MHEPLETAELLAFTRIVEARSFSRAAAELRVPRATIGRRLTRLERRVGARLLRRTTRSLSLTDAGETLYRHARIVLDAVAQAEASVRTKENVMRGDLRVSVPPVTDASFISTIVDFAKEHPDVRLQIDFSTRLVDLRRDAYDVALRATSSIEPGLVARTLARHRMMAVASPSYLAAMGTPRTIKDLRKHRCLTGFARGELPQATWPAGTGIVHVDGVFSSNDLGLLREAALRGLGIALLPQVLLGDLVETGALVHVLPGVIHAESRLAVVYVDRELLPAHVRAFVDAISKWTPTFLPRPERAAKKRRRG